MRDAGIARPRAWLRRTPYAFSDGLYLPPTFLLTNSGSSHAPPGKPLHWPVLLLRAGEKLRPFHTALWLCRQSPRPRPLKLPERVAVLGSEAAVVARQYLLHAAEVFVQHGVEVGALVRAFEAGGGDERLSVVERVNADVALLFALVQVRTAVGGVVGLLQQGEDFAVAAPCLVSGS